MTARSIVRRAGALALVVLLAACGGGGGGGSGDSPSVTNLGASSQRYATTTFVTVQGRNLRSGSGVDLEVKGACENPARVASDDNTQQFRCDIRGVGELKFAVYDIDTRRYLGELTLVVPMPQVAVSTSQGNFTLELNPVAAPLTVQHFLGYANDPGAQVNYNNTIVHRVIKDVGIETGSFTRGRVPKTGQARAIAVEATGLSNLRGTVAMQRLATTADRVGAMWFVNLADNTDLDARAGFTGNPVFGRVVSGLDVVERIAATETGIDPATGAIDTPVTEVLVTSVVHVR